MKHNENRKNTNGRITISVDAKTLDKLQTWALHTYRDLSENYLHFDRAYAKGMFGIGYTETELNQMIADAGLLLSLSNPYDDDRYCVTGANVFESCMGIISICKAYINALHESIEASKPGRISVVKTMSEGLKYTDADDWDDF